MVSAGQNVFTGRLASDLAGISGVNTQLVIATGATKLRTLIPNPADYHAALEVYNSGLTRAFEVSLIVACLAVVGAIGMEWKSVKVKGGKPRDVSEVSGAGRRGDIWDETEYNIVHPFSTLRGSIVDRRIYVGPYTP